MKETLVVQPPRSPMDRIGVFLAAVCIVHRTALPLAIMTLPLLAQIMPESHWVDGPLVALAAPLCVVAMVQGWRLHGSLLPSAFAAPGVVLLVLSVAIGERYGVETILASSGASLIGVAHLLNLRGSRYCGGRCDDERPQ